MRKGILFLVHLKVALKERGIPHNFMLMLGYTATKRKVVFHGPMLLFQNVKESYFNLYGGVFEKLSFTFYMCLEGVEKFMY